MLACVCVTTRLESFTKKNPLLTRYDDDRKRRRRRSSSMGEQAQQTTIYSTSTTTHLSSRRASANRTSHKQPSALIVIFATTAHANGEKQQPAQQLKAGAIHSFREPPQNGTNNICVVLLCVGSYSSERQREIATLGKQHDTAQFGKQSQYCRGCRVVLL